MKDIRIGLIGTGGMGKAQDLVTAVALHQPVQPDVCFAYQINKIQ